MQLAGRLLENGEFVQLEIANKTISHIELLDTAPNIWISPGLIDIQINGYEGYDVNNANILPEEIVQLTHALWRCGVTAFCPTIITESETHICKCLRAIAAACEADKLVSHSILAIHVEGPYISLEDGPRGAHPLKYVRVPSVDEYFHWQEAAGGRIGIITLSPEHSGTLEYIQTVINDGVIVAIGHTAASESQIRAAVDAGARLSTHLGNGSHAQIKRHHNYIWEQLSEDRLYASFICDGHHLPSAVIKSLLRAKGSKRSILISDAVALAGHSPGIYETPVGGKVELLPSGRLNLYGTPYLAGSTSNLPKCIANVIRYADINLLDAIRMASLNPACLLGLDTHAQRLGVQVGTSADLTLFHLDSGSGEMIIDATIVCGELVYRRSNTSLHRS
jgi:N-acetylglucosamine-6-phosphate deacetylase